MKSFKILSKRTYLLISSAFFLFLLCPLITNYASAAAFDIWDGSGYIDEDGNRYSERMTINFLSVPTPKINAPVKITPFFSNGHCAINSTRILHESTGLVEIPYIMVENVTFNNENQYLSHAEIIFVAPILPGKYYLVYSDNLSIPAPNYTGQYLTVYNNSINDFYENNLVSYSEQARLAFSAAGNQSRKILIPDAGTGMFMNITSATFDVDMQSRFIELNNITIPDRFVGMGPTSVRFYNGSIFGYPNLPYLLIGWPRNLTIHRYNVGGYWDSIANISVPDNPSGAPAQVSGMYIGNITNDNKYQIAYGTKFGTVYVHDFNGTGVSEVTKNLIVSDGTNLFQNAYGITSINITNPVNWGVDDDMDLDFVIAGSGHSGTSNPNNGRIQTFQINGSLFEYGTSASYGMYMGYSNNSNYSVRLYAQKDHQVNQLENFFEGTYQITTGTFFTADMDEYMAVGLNPKMDSETGQNNLILGVYHPYRSNNNTLSVNIVPRLRQSNLNFKDEYNYYNLVPASGGTIAYSKDFSNNVSYSVIAGGYNTMNQLAFKWYDFNKVEDSGPKDNFLTGYMNLIQNKEILTPSFTNPTYKQNIVLGGINGNFDGINPQYDDALFVDSYGRFYYLEYNSTHNSMNVSSTEFMFDPDMDLYGTGQSIDAIDYNGDGVSDLVVGDSNGVVHFMNYSLVRDVNVWINNSQSITNILNHPDRVQYYSNYQKTPDFSLQLNNSIGQTSYVDGNGQKFWINTIDVGTGSASVINILNLSIYYDTNNYSLVPVNQFTPGDFDYTLSNVAREFSDLDGDYLWDFYEARGIFCWSNTTSIGGQTRPHNIVYRMYIGDNDFITFQFNVTYTYSNKTSAFSADSDGDGINDGIEVLKYQTNPMVIDTDNDGLTDGQEITNTTYYYNPTKSDTDGEGLSDLAEWVYGSNPNNVNTDGDSVEFYSTIYKQNITYFLNDFQKATFDFGEGAGLNPSIKDTDGDGLSDLQELGLWNPSDSNSYLGNILKSGGGNLQYYAWNKTFINAYYPSSFNIVEGLNPIKSDTDGDGLNDYEEIFGINVTSNIYRTNPVANDTDLDGLLDGIELYGWNFNKTIPGILMNITFTNMDGANETLLNRRRVLDPDNDDSDDDGLNDGSEVLTYKTDPINSDTDGDKLFDGEEVNGVTNGNNELPSGVVFSKTNPSNADYDGDGLSDGEEVYGRFFTLANRGLAGRDNYFYIVITFDPNLVNLFGESEAINAYSDPTKNDTDGDGLSDYDEVLKYFTNPVLKDTDGDGTPDNEDRWPVLYNAISYVFLAIMFMGGVGSVVAIPLNRYSASKALARKFLYKEKIERRTKGMDRERKEARAFSVRANSIPTETPGKFRVKITMEIKDSAFFGRAARASYSAGTSEFTLVNAEKIEQEKYVFTLENIPVDERVIYFVEFLDKSGIWVRDDNDGKFFQFATNKDGTIDTSDEDEWKVEHGVKCPVCGYLCQRTWDECPECGTKLYDDASLSILQDDQKKKEEALKREKDVEAIAWEEAQQTDEVWRGLPPCPQCGVAVQPDWAACPVCQFDLTSTKLKKEAAYAWEEIDADYLEGKEEEEIKTDYENDVAKVKSEKEILDELDQREKKKKQDAWKSSDQDGDIL